MGKVISFINQKGGVGKTTMAFNIAHALKEKNKKVLCIDLDPQGNLSFLMNGQSETHLFHLLINSIKELKYLHGNALLSEVIKKGEIDLIPSGSDLSGFELTVASVKIPRQLILKRFIDQYDLKNRYDYIILDCPPTLGLLVINALCASDGVIVPFKPDDFSKLGLKGFYDVLDEIDDMGIVVAPDIILHIPNLVDRRKQHQEDLSDIAEGIIVSMGQNKISDAVLNKNAFNKILSQKKSVYDFHTSEFNELQKQFSNMAEKIVEWDHDKN